MYACPVCKVAPGLPCITQDGIVCRTHKKRRRMQG
jgi:hypothetical protein